MKIGKEIFRFLIAGAAAGGTDFGVYYLLINFLSYSWAKGISFTCGCIVAYLLNKYWVFQHSHASSYPELIRYLIISLLALGVNILINLGILKLRPGAVLLAWIIASMSTGLLTFIGFKLWVFRER